MNSSTISWLDPRLKRALKGLYDEWRMLKNHQKGVRYVQENCNGKRPLRVQFGCGPQPKPGWLNTDLWPGPWATPDICLDVSRPFPFESNSVAEIYTEHMVEHLEYPNAIRHFLSECHRVLEPGGRITIGVPDLDGIEGTYERLTKANTTDIPMQPHYILGHPVEELNYSFHQDGEHKFLYNEAFMVALMKNFDFTEIKRRPWDASVDSEVRREGTLYVTALKP